MALAEIQALKDLAKEMGIQEGPDLTVFLRDERARARKSVKQTIGLENSNRKQTIGLENSNRRQLIGIEIRNTR